MISHVFHIAILSENFTGSAPCFSSLMRHQWVREHGMDTALIISTDAPQSIAQTFTVGVSGLLTRIDD